MNTILTAAVSLTADGAIGNPPIFEQATAEIIFSTKEDARKRHFDSVIKWSAQQPPHFTFTEEGIPLFSGTLSDLKEKNDGKVNTDTRENLIMVILLKATMDAMVAAQKHHAVKMIYDFTCEMTTEQLNEIFTD